MWHYIYIRFYNEIRFILKVVLYILLISTVAAMFTGCYSYSESINDRFNKMIEEKCDGNTLGFTYSGIEIECQNISEELARKKLETEEYLEKIRPYMPKPPKLIDSSIRWVGNCIVTESLYDNGKINTLIRCI